MWSKRVRCMALGQEEKEGEGQRERSCGGWRVTPNVPSRAWLTPLPSCPQADLKDVMDRLASLEEQLEKSMAEKVRRGGRGEEERERARGSTGRGGGRGTQALMDGGPAMGVRAGCTEEGAGVAGEQRVRGGLQPAGSRMQG